MRSVVVNGSRKDTQIEIFSNVGTVLTGIVEQGCGGEIIDFTGCTARAAIAKSDGTILATLSPTLDVATGRFRVFISKVVASALPRSGMRYDIIADLPGGASIVILHGPLIVIKGASAI